jgi:hypothetical protein
MSDILYIAIQGVILICYASWIFYRIGYQRGKNAVWDIYLNNIVDQKIPFKSWKDIK